MMKQQGTKDRIIHHCLGDSGLRPASESRYCLLLLGYVPWVVTA